jgi:hypothetical protein
VSLVNFDQVEGRERNVVTIPSRAKTLSRLQSTSPSRRYGTALTLLYSVVLIVLKCTAKRIRESLH